MNFIWHLSFILAQTLFLKRALQNSGITQQDDKNIKIYLLRLNKEILRMKDLLESITIERHSKSLGKLNHKHIKWVEFINLFL